MENRTVLITGSSKGLGAELAFLFAKQRFNIILHGRNKEALQQVSKKLSEFGIGIDIVQGDIKYPETLDKLYEKAREKNIDILINNAGIGLKMPLNEIIDEKIDDILATNLLSVIKLTKRVYGFFIEKKKGTIININSMSGRENHFLRTVYCASKWGLRGFADTLQKEALEHGVRILNIYPTMIKTSLDYTEGMETYEVAEKIYAAFENPSLTELIIDGRPKK